MEIVYKEYYGLSSDDIKDLWEKAIFVFDTNILFNLYRYSDETSSKFIDIIEKLDCVWIPYQVGLEFFRNRLTVLCDQKKSYDDFEKKIFDLIATIEDKNRNPFFSTKLVTKLTSIKDDIRKEVHTKRINYDNAILDDKILKRITKIFSEKIGSPLSSDQLKVLYSEGEKRYKENIPPGYKDKAKPNNDKYGDLVLWKEMLYKCQSDAKDLIFICDDRKEDWWLEHQGKTISPRPELLKEFNSETKRECHFYKPFQFLEFANKYLDSKIKSETIEEVKNYTFNKTPSIDFVLFNITLKGSDNNINIFISDLKQTGYNIYKEDSINDTHYITITLPKISDLERRLTEKYFDNLFKYNLELIEIKKA